MMAGLSFTCPAIAQSPLQLEDNSHITFVGNGLGSRMLQYGHFETEVYARNANKNIRLRNLCDEGNTPGFRAHPGRATPFAFSGAETFYPPLSTAKDRWGSTQRGRGSFKTPDQWLTSLKTDVLVGFFGYNSSFYGEDGLKNYAAELRAFVKHTKAQRYNGSTPPTIVLVSPIAFDSKTSPHDKQKTQSINANLERYTKEMALIAKEQGLPFVDAFTPSQQWYQKSTKPLTVNGFMLNDNGYQLLAKCLADTLLGKSQQQASKNAKVLPLVQDKNWLWSQYYKIPNGVHVYGRRHKPFGPKNYPYELKKLEQMIANRDLAIQAELRGKVFNVAEADKKTIPLPVVTTNFRSSVKNGNKTYLYGQDALDSFKIAKGFKLELFASEKEFPNLANPMQITFDNKGRLWVTTMPSYPHYQVGDKKPNDKILIYEDTNNDGKADKETVFADKLHLPTGFEITHEGVYVAQGTHLVLLKDTNNDDKADHKEIILSGFDDHDSHHVISAFCADPFGRIIMSEGTFLHSNVETADGPIRSSNGGFFNYDPRTKKLTRQARLSIPNPWGTAFNNWGQGFFADTSDPNVRWLTPGSLSVPYGQFAPLPNNLVENAHRVRPTAGLEFVSSSHFPKEMQGDYLINNTIGFRGTKQHTLSDDKTGYTSKFRQDLLYSTDGNYRPVDLEFAPDGSLFIADWHNILIGHMQHNARDPLRDHQHGRIYRVTHSQSPLLKPAQIAGAPISTLLENLKLPEIRTRYRSRIELRSRDPKELATALTTWVQLLDRKNSNYDQALLEALYLTTNSNSPNKKIYQLALNSKNSNLRCMAIQALEIQPSAFGDATSILTKSIQDPNGRVKLSSIVTASWIDSVDSKKLLSLLPAASRKDPWIAPVFKAVDELASGKQIASIKKEKINTNLKGADKALYIKGHEVYNREAHCATCHQENGLGLPAAMFPPLAKTKWVQGSGERLVKLTLHGLHGPIEIKGKKYPGQVPMTSFKGLSDDEIAAVLTYVRNSFGNKSPAISPAFVKQIRKKTATQKSFYAPADLLKQHPHDK